MALVWPQWSGDVLGINSGFGDTSVRSHIELVPLSVRGFKHGSTVDWQWSGDGLAAGVVSYSSSDETSRHSVQYTCS